jgi:hypothetical protein
MGSQFGILRLFPVLCGAASWSPLHLPSRQQIAAMNGHKLTQEAGSGRHWLPSNFGRALRCTPRAQKSRLLPAAEKLWNLKTERAGGNSMLNTWKKIGLIALVLFCIRVSDASALTIETHFIGGVPPANAVGAGNLSDIVNAAASIWESAYSDPITITLYYGWAQLGQAGNHILQESDSQGREISGTILFDNSGAVAFYLDPTPNSNEEYQRRSDEYQDLGNGLINAARVYSNPVGEAAGHVDLLTVVLHEMGHSLGLSESGTRFIEQSAGGFINVLGGLPFSGISIPLAHNNSGVVPHIDSNQIVYGTLMSGVNGDERRLPSSLDVLADAQVSGFTIAEFYPGQAPQQTAALIGGSGERENSLSGFKRVIEAPVVRGAAPLETVQPFRAEPMR